MGIRKLKGVSGKAEKCYDGRRKRRKYYILSNALSCQIIPGKGE